jgi:peptide deformylase
MPENYNDIYDIIKVPDPVLKERAQVIESIDADIKKQIDKMVNTMYEGAGIGLAANQVNILNRVFVMDLPEGSWAHGPEVGGVLTIDAGYRSGEGDDESMRKPRAFINPEVIWESEQRSVYDEGCLSIPHQYGEVIRPAQVRVTFQDAQGDTQEELFDGLDSHCVQHEIDHLNGVLFIDYLSSLKRNMILRKMKKYNKDAQAL